MKKLLCLLLFFGVAFNIRSNYMMIVFNISLAAMLFILFTEKELES